jgi:hypothetical protein
MDRVAAPADRVLEPDCGAAAASTTIPVRAWPVSVMREAKLAILALRACEGWWTNQDKAGRWAIRVSPIPIDVFSRGKRSVSQ